MTILAGIFSRDRRTCVNDADCGALKGVLSRNADDEIIAFQDSRTYLAKVDIGAYRQSAIQLDPAGSVSMLAGEPLILLDDGALLRTRADDLFLLHQACDQENWEILKKGNGVFCAIHYQPRKSRLTLIADKLCIRPLYYWVGERYVVFASALRIFEALSIVPKVMDVRGVIEIASMGYPLGIRSPYIGINLLRAAEVVQFSDTSVSHSQYWRWDRIPESKQPELELLQLAYGKFSRAIRRRLRSDSAAVAFLSGGLDSRCVVASLRSRNIVVHTFNFSYQGTHDQLLGAEFARQSGTIHAEAPLEMNPHWSMLMSSAWSESKHRANCPIERPQCVWSGDGGSVGVGHVYLDEAIVNFMRNGKIDSAIRAFLGRQKAGFMKGLFKACFSRRHEILELGIREELEKIDCNDPGRRFHIFLLLNDQRRHLSRHFEDIDLHRLEFHLPFFDGEFLNLILQCPIDWCLGHRFYVKWLRLFPSVVTSVPWQAYPGHEPSTLPIPEGLIYQWDPDHRKELSRKRKSDSLEQACQFLKAGNFPYKMIDKKRLILATLIYQTGLRDYGYLIKTAGIYYKYWVLCGGNYVLSSERQT